ncbi:MAG: CxxxxCH/CxxCH domain-containing protein [Nitrospiraceae bacterium]|nr:CxxxxCH/CxxCH domain-containing protein [Nitrospiraceae bacterium]
MKKIVFTGSFVVLCLLLAAAVLTSCSSGSSSSVYNPAAGGHPAGWSGPDTHGANVKSKADGFSSCQECHGADFAGGISSTSCFGCHGVQAPHSPKPWRGAGRSHTNTDPGNAPVCFQCHANGANSTLKPTTLAATGTAPGCFNNTLCHATPGHPSGWKDPAQHGASAKKASNGFSTCQTCHGTDFAGGTAEQSCFTCHGVNAPHPPQPWRGTDYTHTTTDPGNASVCASCHAGGANSTRKPSQPAPAGTAPGCFNNTLCHAAEGHDAGWNSPDVHGASVKSQPNGFITCQECHGPSYGGGAAAPSCFTCHGVSAPHSPKPWRGTGRTHTNTDPGNATACAICHTNGANSTVFPSTPAAAGTAPGCFNNTLCHATVGHPAGWNNPDSHGATVKATVNGFAGCQTCHGSGFAGGTAGVSCFTCHGVNAPHSPKPWRSPGRTHTTTDQSNATVCAVCHTNGANSTVKPLTPAAAGTAPGCFNNTLCHATPGHPAGWSNPDSHGLTVKSQPNGFSTCEACHGQDFSGGTAGVACSSCHGVNAPHSPKPWRSPGRTHTTTDQGNAPVCAQCHTNGANSSVAPLTPAPAGTAPGCFNNTLCHATPNHPAGWSDPTQHGVTAEKDFSACKTCHGTDFKGGTAGVSCYSCHNGPGLNHPAPAWVVADHKAAATTDSTPCQKCHGADYLGGGSHVACKSCHMENQTKVHILAWYPDVQTNHHAYAVANGTSTCSNIYCHGANLLGVANSGPSCATCHTWPFTDPACGSCHGIPPSGAAYPNTAGAHAVHMGLNNTITCATCHNGAGSGTAFHYDGIVEISIDPAYNGKAGAATFNSVAKTCSNVACHGGPRTQNSTQAAASQSTLSSTPVWLTGAIDVNAQCTACHVFGSSSGQPENNSYYSGQHYLHVWQQGRACTVCHNTGALASVHFTSLTAPLSAATASSTLNTTLHFNGSTCNPSAGGLSGCHSQQTW